ncbi:MAG TPA: hypothetical protein VFX89_05055, partial [Gammaproteobacteria bacterium]|nr:hypothetical protein [Gammaproteobacteria bacterium]
AAAAVRDDGAAGSTAARGTSGLEYDYWLRRRLRMSVDRTPPPTVHPPRRSESEISQPSEVGGVFSFASVSSLENGRAPRALSNGIDADHPESRGELARRIDAAARDAHLG